MSSALQSALTNLRQNNYESLAMLIAAAYDYVLTFSDEIEYIWTKSWTWVSTLFILVRYAGLCSFAFACLLGTSFVPGPPKTCQIIYTIGTWAYPLFSCAADFVMILRLWAMYNRSKLILRIFLSLSSLKLISSLIGAAISSDPRILPVDTNQILDFSFCVWQRRLPSLATVASILQITHGAAMCIFAIAHWTFVKQSLRVTKQRQLNHYMNFLVKQGILYFFYFFLFDLISILNTFEIYPTVGWQLFAILQYVPMYVLTPRFILSIRELYARDVQGRRGEGIDTGFGLSSSGTEIVFADIELNEGLEDDVWGRRGDGVDTGFGLSSSGHGAVGDGDGTRGC